MLVGPRFNLPAAGDLFERFFIGGAVGFTYFDLGESTTKFTFAFDLGKRFKLAENVAYVPRAAMVKVADSDTAFAISPIAFSIGF